ncbi:MAG: type II toxin-antitoxin system HipA family toxin [Alphaproteobacteria bacterium]|nr:type II toxin-antitoxin system HipA family toxin [Alphaproteobacteria bacterium]
MVRVPRIPLNVFLNSRLVGQMNREANGGIVFRYDKSWLAWEYALPVSLSLPLREDGYAGSPVIAVLDNLLPDNPAIRRRVAERVHARSIAAYDLLAAVGRDCVGALQFLPDGVEPGAAGAVSARSIEDHEIARLLRELASNPLGLGTDEDFRISIAGAQEKTALLFMKGRWYKPLATTATTHILKPPIGILPNGMDLSHSVENEFFCLKLIAALGLPSAAVAIERFEGSQVLVIDRFDRRWTRDNRLLRLPQEDCCQALSVSSATKYESDGGPGIPAILNLLKGSNQREADQRMFLKALMAFWLLGATDGHAKNFSVFLSPGGRFRMTPLYDVLSAQPCVDARQIRRNGMKLAMAVGDRRHSVIDGILARHFVQTAAKAGIGAAIVTGILEELHTEVPAALDRVTGALPGMFPDRIADSISAGVRMRLGRLEYR